MFNLISAMTFNKDTLFKALEITWKGMLAILIVILVVMLVTYLMQFVSGKWAARKEKAQSAAKNADDGDERQA